MMTACPVPVFPAHRFGCALLSLTLSLSLGTLLADDWEMLEDVDNRFLEARILSVENGTVTFIRKLDGQKFELPVTRFSEDTRERFEEFGEEVAEEEQAEADGGFSKKLYPRTRSEIKEGIREIERRDKPSGIDGDQHEAVTELNIYRFLCGVSYDVEADSTMVDEAVEAAEACKKHGSLSHDIGSHTERCNLSPIGDIVATVRNYIHDPGKKNRQARAHRRWCLNPRMEKTGFGSAGSSYSAMWAMDTSGSRISETWGYPGKGFFPLERLHGKGWSYYLNEKAPDESELEVKVWKLHRRPDRTLPWSDEPEGRELPVGYVNSSLNSINFEPEPDPITSRGIYWVRIKGGGLREQYLVELY